LKKTTNNKIYLNGRITLEAAIVVPIVMLIILLMVKTSVDIYSVNREDAVSYVQSIQESINNFDKKRKKLYEYKLIKDEIDKFTH